jgi:anthranilate synthase component II
VEKHPMILLIDNYDSFTWNVVHLLQDAGCEVKVARNDEISVDEAMAMGAQAVILSPGPCTPEQAGISIALVKACHGARKPLLGICLGHQAIAAAFGGNIARAEKLMHGKTSRIRHQGNGLFAGLPDPFTAARYHSLVARGGSLPDSLEITARAEDDGEIMGLKVKGAPVFGVQFHPESIATDHGLLMVENLLLLAGISKGRAA